MSVEHSSAVWEWIAANSVKNRMPNGLTNPVCHELLDATCRCAEIVFGLIGRIIAPKSVLRSTGGTVAAGDREQVLSALSSWAAEQGDALIRISDPYFGLEEMQLIRLLAQAGPALSFRIATSREKLKALKVDFPEESFLAAWQELVDIDPPKITVAAVGFGVAGKHPIHDRWIVCSTSGWRLGTSFGSIGVSRVSDLSPIAAEDAHEKTEQIDRFFVDAPRTHNGERLLVQTFSL